MVNFYAIKQKTHEIASTTLTDFTVTWGFTTRDSPRMWAYLGNMTWPSGEWATNRSREYLVRLPVILNAIKVRTTPEAAEAWLSEKCEALITAFDESSAVRDTGAISWLVEPIEFGSQPHPDGIEVQAVLAVSVKYRR